VSGPGTPVPGVDQAAELLPDDPLLALDSPTAGGRVIRGGALRIGTYGAGVALGIASAALMTRHLGVEDFGKYVIVTSLITIVSGLTDAGVSNIAVREFATQERGARDRLIANVIGIRLTVACAGVAAAAAFAILAGYDRTMVIGTVLAGIGLVIATLQQTYTIPIAVALRFGWLSALDLMRQVAFVVVVVVLLLADAGLLPFLAATIPASLVVLAVAIPLVRGTAPLLPHFERSEWLRVLRLVGVYAAAAAVGTIYVSAVIVTTSLVGTDQESGYLGAAFRIFTVLAGIPLLLVTTAFPVLARAAHTDRERLQYAVQRLIDMALIVGTWMALATILGAGVAIDIVAGADFEPAVPVLQIQAVALVAGFLAVTGAFALVSVHRHVALLLGNLVGLIASVVVTAILVPEFGAKGAAFATLAAEAAIAGLYWIVLLGSGMVRYDLTLVPRIVAAGVPAAALVFTPLEDIPLVVAATLVYWIVLLAVRGIPPEVIDALLRRERPETP
jgi:O-antigen/teichoic acid export membrane protein